MGALVYDKKTGLIKSVHLGHKGPARPESYGLSGTDHAVLQDVPDCDMTDVFGFIVQGGRLVPKHKLRLTINGKRTAEDSPFVVNPSSGAAATVLIEKVDASGAPLLGTELIRIFPDHPRIIPVNPSDKVALSGGKASFTVGPFAQAGSLAVFVLDDAKVMIGDTVHVSFSL